MNIKGFRVGFKQRDLGRVIHRLKVKVAAEHNRALTEWEHELRLHVKPCPRFVPGWFWKKLVSLVTVQSAEVTKAPHYMPKEAPIG